MNRQEYMLSASGLVIKQKKINAKLRNINPLTHHNSALKSYLAISIIIFLVISINTGHAAPFSPDQTNEIKIGGIFALNNGTNLGNVERVSALKAAVDEINNNQNLLGDYHLELLISDSRSSPEIGLEVAQQMIDDGVIAIIGPSLSSVADVVAKGPSLAHNIPLISPSATAAILSDKSQYPYFMRLSVSDLYQSRALLDLVRYFGWGQISLISTKDIYGEGNITPLTNNSGGPPISVGIESYGDIADRLNIKIENNVKINASYPDYETALQKIKSSDSNIILVNLVYREAVQLFEKAFELDMDHSHGFVWIGTDGITQNEMIESSDNIRQVLNGMVGISPVMGESRLSGFLDKWESCFTKSQVEYPGCGDRSPNIYVTYTYDSIYFLANSLQELINWDLDFRDGKILRNQLFDQSYLGITGIVKLDGFGDREGRYRVVNLQNDGFAEVGQWSVSEGLEITSTIYWDGNTLGTATEIPVAQNQIFPFPATFMVVIIGLIGLSQYRLGYRCRKK